MGRTVRTLAIAYAVLVAVVAAWAFYVDISMLHSQREHLLADIALAFVTLPSSLSAGLLSDTWPGLFSTPLMQVLWVTLCGFAQAAALFFLPRLFTSRKVETMESTR
jgi:hypothetical protein